MLGNILAGFRFFVLAIILFVFMLLILLTSLLPIRHKGIRISHWLTRTMCILINVMLDVKFEVDNPEAYATHHGFIFPNHTSWIDVPVVMANFPIRYMANHKVESLPMIGQIGNAIDTVWVNRDDKESRQEAKEAMKGTVLYPPIIIFAEGWILPPADVVKPLRHGAFEIAQANNAPILPCVLVYEDTKRVFSEDDNAVLVAWKYCKKWKGARLKIYTLPVVHPRPGDDLAAMADQVQQDMNVVLKRERERIGAI